MSHATKLELDYAATFTASTATAAIATTALAVTTTATWLTVPWQIPALAGTTLTLGALAVSRSRAGLNKPHKVPLALAGTWPLWTALIVTALATDPHTWLLPHWWTATAIFITLWTITYWALDRADILDEAHFAENLHQTGKTPDDTHTIIEALKHDRTRHTLATKWVTDIKHTLGFTPTVTGLTEWDAVNGQPMGFTLALDLPKGASSASFNTTAVRQLAEDAGLPNGCKITTAKGQRQGQILLHVETTNPAGVVHPFEHHDWAPSSILNQQVWGRTPHGQPIGPHLRESGAIIVGPMGSGKTTLLNVIIAQLARCPDTVIWGIDVGKQGKAFRPWTHDLPAGTKPVVERVATNLDQALLMLNLANQAMNHRIHHYAQLQKELNTDLIPVSPSLPYLAIIIDEAAEIFAYDGPRDPLRDQVRAAALKLMRTTREAGCRTIVTFTKADVMTAGSTDFIDYHPIKVGLVGDKDPRATAPTKLFGQVRGVDFAQITAKGAGIADYGQGPQIHMGMRPDHNMIEQAVLNTSPYRPTLDQPTVDAMGAPYTNPDLWGLAGHTNHDETDIPPVNKPVTWTATDMTEFEAQFTPNPDTEAGEGDWLTHATTELHQRRNTNELDGWRKLVLHHLTTHPTHTYSTSDLVTILTHTYAQPITRQTLSTQLTQWANQGTIRVTGTGAHRTYTAP